MIVLLQSDLHKSFGDGLLFKCTSTGETRIAIRQTFICNETPDSNPAQSTRQLFRPCLEVLRESPRAPLPFRYLHRASDYANDSNKI